MEDTQVWSVITIGIILIMFLGNKKVRVFSVFVEQLKVFKNAKTGKYSIWDFLCFLGFPLLLAWIFTLKFSFAVECELAELLTTIFSLIFTILFGFASILIGKVDSQNRIEKQIASETFVSIVTATLLALIATIVSIILTQIRADQIRVVLSGIIYYISFVEIMLLLLITKRTFVVYRNCTKKMQ